MTDDELFTRYRQTHEPALLDELIHQNIDRIYRFVASMMGRRESVDDLVQDVLLNVIRSIDQFRGESAFSTWVYRIAANRVYRYLEKERKSVPTIESEQLEAVADKLRNTPETNELKLLIDAAIEELSPALRTAMVLTTVEGLTPEEAAAVENCTAANIHWRVHKARKILKERLKKYID
ncbi:MAG: RNA polymerase sigma factor [Planctomycetaceae bacterium]|jgi:RNA polymerase sigma-70 factor (ECF subfamily)|nr:RNA polymerase sigma factor [Planctomycetaceae bacterium]